MPGPLTVDLHRVRLRLRTPHRAAHGREEGREVVLVSVTDDDGATGWGECPTLARPGYHAEWTDGAWWVLGRWLAPAVAAGEDVPDLRGHPMAVGALADALVDLDLRRRGVGPASLGAPLAPDLGWGAAVGLPEHPGADGLAEVVGAAEAAVAAGAALVVLKVEPGWSVDPVVAVRHAVGARADLAVDANGSLGLGPELTALDGLGLAFIEQPCPAEDLLASAATARDLATPVALDEGVADRGGLEVALALGAGDALTVKPSRLGGVASALRAVERAAAGGWTVRVGGMLESGVGRSAARVVAARSEVSGPGLVGPTEVYLRDDLVAPIRRPAPGRVPVPTGPGLVAAPDPERLRALRVAHWRISAR